MKLFVQGLLISLILLAAIFLPAQAISLREFPHQIWHQHSASPQLVSAGDEALALKNLAENAWTASRRGDFAAAESYWSEILQAYPESAAAWSNRGITRVSQGKFTEAIADYNQAIAIAPLATDPYLNRGAALEAMGEYQAAIADYNHLLAIDPQDAQAYNNRGNAKMALGDWQGAIADYQTCHQIAPNFAFALASQALATYQLGDTQTALQMMRNLNRQYPQFADMRAALTAALWVEGKQGEAESNWVAAVGLDPRYQDLNWVKTIRRWPPAMVAALEKFLHLSSP